MDRETEKALVANTEGPIEAEVAAGSPINMLVKTGEELRLHEFTAEVMGLSFQVIAREGEEYTTSFGYQITAQRGSAYVLIGDETFSQDQHHLYWHNFEGLGLLVSEIIELRNSEAGTANPSRFSEFARADRATSLDSE